jgi:uncharacterized protein (DUF488 family)
MSAGVNKDETSETVKIWTVGHSTRTLSEFLDLMAGNEIGVLADVRSYPGSRKFPHFNREGLSVSLEAAHVKYVHLKGLGGRRKPRPDSTNTVWRNPSFRAYADYIETDAFRDGINELLHLARVDRTAIMCSEAVWWRCHRSMIADYLKAKGIVVEHIMGPGHNVEHPFTSAARIESGELVYGPAQPLIPFSED